MNFCHLGTKIQWSTPFANLIESFAKVLEKAQRVPARSFPSKDHVMSYSQKIGKNKIKFATCLLLFYFCHICPTNLYTLLVSCTSLQRLWKVFPSSQILESVFCIAHFRVQPYFILFSRSIDHAVVPFYKSHALTQLLQQTLARPRPPSCKALLSILFSCTTFFGNIRSLVGGPTRLATTPPCRSEILKHLLGFSGAEPEMRCPLHQLVILCFFLLQLFLVSFYWQWRWSLLFPKKCTVYISRPWVGFFSRFTYFYRTFSTTAYIKGSCNSRPFFNIRWKAMCIVGNLALLTGNAKRIIKQRFDKYKATNFWKWSSRVVLLPPVPFCIQKPSSASQDMT